MSLVDIRFLCTLLLAGTVFGEGQASNVSPLGPVHAFSFEDLKANAKRMASRPYLLPASKANERVAQIDYPAWQAIQFLPSAALFSGPEDPFPVSLFHVGRSLPHSVRIHTLDMNVSREFFYDPQQFRMPADSPALALPPETGFAGLRVHESKNNLNWWETTWLSFLGGTFFRAIGESAHYGLSAMAVSVDGDLLEEEFPNFTDLYIQESHGRSEPVTVYALIDGPSLTGAMRFTNSHTESTVGVVQEVEAEFFIRERIQHLGFMPLRTLFWFSETEKRRLEDWRPEVHDSDGVLISTHRGQWIWQPLVNPSQSQSRTLITDSLRGFGLVQRDRDPAHYLDGSGLERRPNVWVEPIEGFERGALELTEIPTDDRLHDNVSVSWRPSVEAKAGAAFRLRYRLHWGEADPDGSGLSKCIGTFIGRGDPSPAKGAPRSYQIAVAFDRDPALGTHAEKLPFTPIIHAKNASVSQVSVVQLPAAKQWQVVFMLQPKSLQAVDLSLHLEQRSKPVTETWNYHFLPDPPG